MATKNKSKAPEAEETTLTPGQKAAATRAANKSGTAQAADPKPPKKVTQKAKEPEPEPEPEVEAEGDAEGEGAEDASYIGRNELVEAIRTTMLETDGVAVSPKVAGSMVKAFEGVIVATLGEGTEVALPGFGKFKLSLRSGGERRNPRTGETFTVDPSWAVSFKPGKLMKDAVSELGVE